jgi:transketolase
MARDEEQVSNVAKGGYILVDCDGEPELIFIATGSEVELAVNAATELTQRGHKIRVVSMPCAELFSAQDAMYKQAVLPIEVGARIAIEAAHEDYWYKFVGFDGRIIGMNTFGESAPIDDLMEHFGFTLDNVLATADELLAE